MKRIHILHLGLGVMLGLLLPASSLAQHRARVAAPPSTPRELIATAAECNAYVTQLPKRQRCLSCVASGHRFLRQGDHGLGQCEGMASPPPQPPPPQPPPPQPPSHGMAQLRTPQQCAQFVPNPQKRTRCFECVRRGGAFVTQGVDGYGACMTTPPPPPPAPPAVPGPEIITTQDDCIRFLAMPAKRARCSECVNRHGQFWRQSDTGWGYCKMVAPTPPPPPPPHPGQVISSKEQCKALIADKDKRHRCRECVKGGGTFSMHGAEGPGHCNTARMPPTAAPVATEFTSVEQCHNQLSEKNVQHRCRKCIEKGGRWDPARARCNR